MKVKVKVKCQKCGGDGWYEGVGTHSFYDGDWTLCHEPEPIQVQCEACCGYGDFEIEKEV